MSELPLTQRLRLLAKYTLEWPQGRALMEEAATEIERLQESDARLRSLLTDQLYIQIKADYNRGHLSHAGSLKERERGLGL